MSSCPEHHAGHPVAAFARRLSSRLDEVAATPLWSMSDTELRETLLLLSRSQARSEAMRLQVLAEADRRGATTQAGAPSAAAYVAVETRQTRRAATSDLKLGLALADHPALADAMAAGHANPAQARAIVKALDALPNSGEFAVDAEQRALAEEHLVALAEHHDADELRVLGRRILEVVAPELAEAFEGRQLEVEEAKAARRTRLEMWEDDEGTCHGRFRIPTRFGHMLRKAVQSLTNPTRFETTAGSPIDTTLPGVVRDGVAFTQILEAVEAEWLPSHGGVGATVVVTMTLEQLTEKLDGVCGLDTGTRISVDEARRLACRAGIIPVVLGGPSVVLDAGTRRRYHSEAQRIALGVRDGGCTAEGCDVPPAMCHAHHDVPHSRGGPTSVANGRLLCGHHHRRLHDPAYEHAVSANNKVTFHRRT